jgi:UDP-glucose 4-epimerase
MGSKVAVFGGSGFLGSHVCDQLSLAGYEVTVVDTKTSPYLRADQKMVVANILDDTAVRKAVEGAEVVYNFAGISDIDECRNFPVKTVEINILGNTRILEACRELKVKRFVFASSVYVYSDAGAFYRASKRACEDFVHLYSDLYGMDFTILRYGTLYGPRSDDRNAVYRYVKSAIEQHKIEYSGTLDSRREYIHIEDAARASVEILKDEFKNQSLVLTGPQSLLISEILGMISEILPEKVDIVESPRKNSAHYKLTPYKFTPNPGKKFVMNPQIDIGEGLLNLIEEIYNKKSSQ